MPRVTKRVRLVNPSFRKMKPILKKKGLKIGLQLKKALKYTSTTRRKKNPGRGSMGGKEKHAGSSIRDYKKQLLSLGAPRTTVRRDTKMIKKRTSNPAKKKLSPLQKLFFGSKRQRSAVAKTLGSRGRKGNPSVRRDKKAFKKSHPLWGSEYASALKSFAKTRNIKRRLKTGKPRGMKKRLPNVGQILAVTPLMNPRSRSKKFGPKAGFLSHWQTKSNRKIRRAKKKGNSIQATYYGDTQWVRGQRKANPKSVTMAKRKTRRKRVGVNQYGMPALGYRKRLRYAGKAKRGQYKYILNPRRRRKVSRRRKTYARKANPTVVIMRGRRRNPSRRRYTKHVGRRRYTRRRNPGFLPKGGMLLRVGGFFGGIFITNMVRNILPMQFRSGVMGILGTGLSAWVASKAIRMVTNNAALANSAFFGGTAVTVVTALKEFAPNVAANLPGLGLIAPSNSLYPQIPSPGAIGPPYDQSVIRGMIPVASAMRGLPAPNVTTRAMRQR